LLQKIKTTILKQLKQGITPLKVSQSVLVGLLVGLFPVIGFTTILCVALGHKLKLSHVIVQGVHHLVFPLQLLIIPVYIKVITLLTGSEHIPARPDHVVQFFFSHPILFLREYGLIAIYAALLWLLISLPLFLLLQKPLCQIVEKFKRDKRPEV
jgi:uncharacterized protein (DUF2062 family)